MLKGLVQYKVWGVETIYNRSVWVWDRGYRHSKKFKSSFRFVVYIFLFPLSTAQLIGDFQKNRQSAGDISFLS
jgi:hypothetical protein